MTSNFKTMKRFIFPILLLCLSLSFTGCEEVIDVDLNESDPKLVVDARLDVDRELIEVKLTRTTSYFAAESPSAVEDALVTVRFAGGSDIPLANQGNGLYSAPATVNEGQELIMTILDRGQEHVASTVVPVAIFPDSLTTEFFEPNSFFDGGSIVRIQFQEPAGRDDFIRVRLWANGEEYTGSDNIVVESGVLADGQYVDYPVFLDFFQPGDSVTVVLQSITEATYDYYLTLQDITQNQGGGNTAAPANPTTNIVGGALGLWDVHHADTISIVITE